MIRLSDIPDYLLLVGVDVAILFFWWKLMALLGDRRMLPSPEVMALHDAQLEEDNPVDGSPAFAANWRKDPSWRNFPAVVKLTMIVALVVSIGILIEGALLMPYGVAMWGWQIP
jgi:hypothetical protein